MAASAVAGLEAELMQEMGLTGAEISRRREIVTLTPADSARIASVRRLLEPLVPGIVDAFFDHLRRFEQARWLLGDAWLLEAARTQKQEHLHAMLGGDYGPEYVYQRVKLAVLYSRGRLPPHLFLGAYQVLLDRIGVELSRAGQIDAYTSVRKVALFDVAIITDVLVYERERIIRQQAEAIRELSAPVLQLSDRLLLLPLIGLIDSHRARQITENLLHGIRDARARVAVIDVTGVANVDSKVAHHLLRAIAAARLMGTRVIVTGLSPEISTALVQLGIDLTGVEATGDLQSALEEAYSVAAP
jgi:rsbT co-antagonist protein RsbR